MKNRFDAYQYVLDNSRWEGDCLIYKWWIKQPRVHSKQLPCGMQSAQRVVWYKHHNVYQHIKNICGNRKCVNINHLRRYIVDRSCKYEFNTVEEFINWHVKQEGDCLIQKRCFLATNRIAKQYNAKTLRQLVWTIEMGATDRVLTVDCGNHLCVNIDHIIKTDRRKTTKHIKQYKEKLVKQEQTIKQKKYNNGKCIKLQHDVFWMLDKAERIEWDGDVCYYLEQEIELI